MRSRRTVSRAIVVSLFLFSALMLLIAASAPAFAQTAAVRDPAEPQQKGEKPKILPRPAGSIARASIDEKSMRALMSPDGRLRHAPVDRALGRRESRPRAAAVTAIVARFNEIAKASGGTLQVVVDKFEATSARTSRQTQLRWKMCMQFCPGTEGELSKTCLHRFGPPRFAAVRRPRIQKPTHPAQTTIGSGVAVSQWSRARLLRQKQAANGQRTVIGRRFLFAAVSGEEQGLLGSTHMVDWLKEKGYTVGGMLDDDIVGDDPAPGAPHRVRAVFRGAAKSTIVDSPSREKLARAVGGIDGRGQRSDMIFRVDRYGRGGDHYPFYKAGLPAVRFTEPLEDYNHQHQTPRTESGVEYGDFAKYLKCGGFLGRCCAGQRGSAAAVGGGPGGAGSMRSLTGAVTPDAKVSWSGQRKIPNARDSRFCGVRQTGS